MYVSVGHQQMMTDPMKPLGLSFFLLTTNALMRKAGGRLFVDVTPLLASPASRESIVDVMGKFDPLMKDALMTIIERGDFIQSLPDDKQEKTPGKSNQGPSLVDFQTLNEYDPAIVSDLIKRSETSIEELKQTIQTKSGSDVFDFILENIQQVKKSLSDRQSFGVIMTAMNASSWINENMKEWLGEKNGADTLSQSGLLVLCRKELLGSQTKYTTLRSVEPLRLRSQRRYLVQKNCFLHLSFISASSW